MLCSNNIVLTPPIAADLPIMFKWINDREQVIFNAPYKPVSEENHLLWFESIQKRSDISIFCIRLKESNILIGSCQLNSINFIHRTAELQIRIGNVTKRSQGFGTEAVKLLLDHAFRDLNLNRVYLHVFSTNTVAIKLYQKIGFSKEGLLRKAAHINGSYIDIIVMGILREEYQYQQNNSDTST